MPETRVLLSLLGEVALLLWGVHMVQTGVVRAFGADLRRWMGGALSSRPRAFLAGMGVTALLQSSTATGLMATGFTASGALQLVPALALMLGAGVGTALIVQLFAFDVSLVFPVLLFAGLIAFRVGQRSRTRDLGRVAIGLGLMLLSLKMLTASATPSQLSPALTALLAQMTRDPVFDILLAGLAAWAAHSSVAIVLVVMSLAGAGVIGPEAALAMVLGANLGSAINPVLEGGPGDPARLRLPLGSLAMRLAGAVVCVPFLTPIAHALGAITPQAGHLAANFHLVFNLGLALVFALPLPLVARMLTRWLPDAAPGADPAAPRHLDPTALTQPPVAIANAARETLRMADALEVMLRGAADVLASDDRKRVADIRRMDDVIDRLDRAVERYLSDVDIEEASETDAKRLAQVLNFATNLEHAGDIVTRGLLEQAAKKIKRRVAFSPDGAFEISAMQDRLLENLALSVSVFMSGDTNTAERLLKQKRRFRELEREAASTHFERLRRDLPESIETSGLHLDIIRDLVRINSHLAAAAYPLLEHDKPRPGDPPARAAATTTPAHP
ncbi:MAG: putative Na+/phosphate transporter [Caulobacter sp.]|nr:putative Na+/phosphate transporter [Caulobacter sp.]